MITGSDAAKPAIPGPAGPLNPNPNSENLSTKGKATATSKPAIGVITDFGAGLSGKEPENSNGVGSASTCETYREIIELVLSRDRNAMAIWQDLVSDYGSWDISKAFSKPMDTRLMTRSAGREWCMPLAGLMQEDGFSKRCN